MDPLDWSICYREIIEQAAEAIILADCDGVIRLWNRGAQLIFGFTAAEALGQSLDLIIPERLQARHWEGYRRVMNGGGTRYADELLNVPARCRDGRQISCAFSIVMVHDQEGTVVGIAAIMRDVTAQWQRERELQQRLTTVEAQGPPRS
jgi:PAS domain S-box-containing protein